jgi:carbon-monoxide dehydrogenase large subunit
MCGAIHRAAGELRAKAIRIAAHLLSASPDDVRLEDDCFFILENRSQGIGWRTIAHAALIRTFELPPDVEPGLDARATYFPPRIDWTADEFGRLNACPTYSNSTHVAIVAVDVGTGEVRVTDYGIFHDCGRVINPLVVAGQIHGGVAQGIAGALYEELAYDDEAQPLSTTFADYLLPTAAEIPAFDLEELETPAPEIPLGVKGVGESGTIGPPAAIVSAIDDALAGFASAQITRTPVTPIDILQVVERGEGR